MASTVIGIFDSASQAQAALDALVSGGFSRSAIDLSTTQEGSTQEGSTQEGSTLTPGSEPLAEDTQAAGRRVGSFFSSLFGGDDHEDTRKYAAVGSRGSIVTVHTTTDDEAGQAADILDDQGAVNVNEKAATYGYAAPSGTGMTDASSPVAATDGTIKVIQEELQVGKRTVETGGVRVRSLIVTKPVEESVRLREERVTVQRTPVNRVATAGDLTAFQEGRIELTQHAEVLVVSKEARVVEEISVGKDVTERQEVIRDTVRHTEVDVEQLGSTGPVVRPEGTDDATDGITYASK